MTNVEKPLILMDCDGVGLDWYTAFRAFCMREKGLNPAPGGPNSWDMRPWLGLDDKETVRAYVSEFNSDREEFGDLPAICGAEIVLPRLASAGHRFVAITSATDSSAGIARRKDNLIKRFGAIFEEIHVLPLGADKGEILARYPASPWIEDNVDNARRGRELGHTAIVMRGPHNRAAEPHCDGSLSWVDDWHDIHALLQGQITVAA